MIRESVRVRGYTKKDGTYVKPHDRHMESTRAAERRTRERERDENSQPKVVIETVEVKPHKSHSKDGTTEQVGAYRYRRKEIKYDGNFEKVERQAEEEYYRKYRAEGMPRKEARARARESGKRVAGSVYWEKRRKDGEEGEHRSGS